jgi:DNA phosphorothioation-dependent restriction protein DptG
MKDKKYVQGVTFFTTIKMYQQVKKLSDEKRIALSELLREAIDRYLEAEDQIKDNKSIKI